MGELGELAKHDGAFRALGVDIVALSVDPLPRARQVWHRFGEAFPVLSDAKFRAMQLYGTRSPEYKNQLGIHVNTPTLILVDARGVIRWIHQAQNFRIRSTWRNDLAHCRAVVGVKPRPGF
jgi:peroxiredoxin